VKRELIVQEVQLLQAKELTMVDKNRVKAT